MNLSINDSKVLGAVISHIAVEMMDLFQARQGTPNNGFSDKAMLQDAATVNSDPSVTNWRMDILCKGVARLAAILLLADSAWSDVKNFRALHAGYRHLLVVMSFLALDFREAGRFALIEGSDGGTSLRAKARRCYSGALNLKGMAA